MLLITLTYGDQKHRFEHGEGPIEFGRGGQRGVKRIVIDDPSISRNQLSVEEQADGRVRIENLSNTNAIALSDGTRIPSGVRCDLYPPVALAIRAVRIEIAQKVPDERLDPDSLKTVIPSRQSTDRSQGWQTLTGLGEKVTPEKLTQWLEKVISLQMSENDAAQYYAQTAAAMVNLIGLDLGLVLLRKDDEWRIVGSHTNSDRIPVRFSRSLLNYVVKERRTFYEDVNVAANMGSLVDVLAAVVSPIFGTEDQIIGALYGVRCLISASGFKEGRRPGVAQPIQVLEAQVVQLLAAAVGAQLLRAQTTHLRSQFEQFFSAELARELERDPSLLEGRSQVVTVLFSDLRGFTSLSERLGPQVTCRLMRDVMEQLSQRIMDQGGVIVDYAGDGILAMWNAPVLQEDHAIRACRAALAMLAELPALNTRWQEMAGNPLRLGIGVNTGTAQVGNTGSSRKLKYGPHGHTVNLASRIQDASKKLGVPLLITRATRDLLPDSFLTQPTAPVALPGTSEPMTLFELTGASAASCT
jgi:adenylate cyclase